MAGENISKQRREKLLGYIASIKAYLEQTPGKNASQLLVFAAELEKEVLDKKFGLVFEEHREGVDDVLARNLPVLKEVKSRFVGDVQEAEAPLNFLIEGDNLAALKLLEKTHRGKIDLIYIDPPYNTGNKDFVYNDAFVDKNDTFRHSKWLSFMKKRLEMAKKLMSEKGVLFISIDDNEQAALKLLCDKIFDEANFVATLHWKKKKQPSFLHGQVAGVMEYVLVVAKDRSKIAELSVASPTDSNTRIDNAANQKTSRVIAAGVRVKLPANITCIPKGVYENKTMNTEYLQDVFIKDGRTLNQFTAIAQFRDSQIRIDEFCKEDVFFITKNYGFRRDKLEHEKTKRKQITDLLLDWGDNQDSDNELRKVFDGEKIFGYPKPVLLIKNLVKSASWTNEFTSLDFFAGSGTTGHAVMKLNAEDGGKRKYILVTNNENGICEKVTYERLKRVIAQEKYQARLKYLKVDYVPITEEDYHAQANKLLQYVRELVELENGIDFAHDATVEIVLTDEEVKKLVKDDKKLQHCKTIYHGHDTLIGRQAKATFARYNIELKTIPDYYYPELEK